MPFMNVSILDLFSATTINDFTAGPDQFVTCSISVTLTAVVNEDLTGHTILWEQISGDTNITYTTPQNQLIVSYTTAIFTDRVFRFYIDKNTPFEVFDDVTVFGTPTSISHPGLPGENDNIIISYVDSSFPTERIPILRVLRHFPTTFSANGSFSCGQNIEHALSWTMPGGVTKIVNFLVQQFIGGVFVTIGTLPASARMYTSGILPNTVYRVVSTYNDEIYNSNLDILTAYPSTSVFTTVQPLRDVLNIQGSDATIVGLPGDNDNVRILTYTVTLLVVINCFNPIDESRVGLPGDDGNVRMNNFTVTYLTLTTCDNIDMSNAGLPGDNGNVRMLTYMVANLGGGSVGGP